MSENGKPKRRLRRRLGWVALGFVLVVALLAGVGAYALQPGGDPADPAGTRDQPAGGARRRADHSDGQRGERDRLARRQGADRAAGVHRHPVRGRAGSSALAVRAAERRCTRDRSGTTLLNRCSTRCSPDARQRRFAQAEREPHHAAARCRSERAAEGAAAFLKNLQQPFGMALIGDTMYVAGTGRVWRFRTRRRQGAHRRGRRSSTCRSADTTTTGPATSWPSADGSKLYVTVGSGSKSPRTGSTTTRAARRSGDQSGWYRRTDASLRHAQSERARYEPQTQALWTVVNERDMLGDDLVPDYFTRVQDGDFYGWPWSYWGKNVDTA